METKEMMEMLSNSFDALQQLEMPMTANNASIMNGVFLRLKEVYQGLEEMENAKADKAGTDKTGNGNRAKADTAGRDKN
jgi:hypothetical protein